VNTFDAVQIIVAAEKRTRRIGAADDAPVDVTVTPEPAAKLVRPTPMDCTFICSPAANTEGGIVITMDAAFDDVTSLPESPATSV
jgi:hypothetical protein